MIEIISAGTRTYAPDFEAVAALSQKLTALAKGIGPVEKDGTNKHFHYKFVSYEQVASMIRVQMADVGLSFSVGCSSREQAGNIAVLGVEATFTDNDTGAMRVVQWFGEGQDTQDKGTSKALTSAVKYGLMRMLLLSTQDDVDSDKDEPPTQQRQTNTNKQATGTDQQATGTDQQTAPTRPYPPTYLRKAMYQRLHNDDKTPPSSGLRGATVGALNSLFEFAGDDKAAAEQKRHMLTYYLIGKQSSMGKDGEPGWSALECNVLIQWAQVDGETGKEPQPMAVKEAAQVVSAFMAESGQSQLQMEA